ncbi:putative transcriptional regulator [Sphaerochaeta pleomorpha str. Grapes]|uniref:Putative transcriptional regulator n=1 Tax=Sphaerochaeta pleomorpha (strain ATCC BAA-1885 / DSM 22778 / Grapes) TaxID=158190 RepID=G8QYJ0_SPHPG|nr:metalloregulator ArsR/SmtB family transcription factor [Sphaerochaeta pleomorpha]AEV28553.1 putative transcriptional regulator [Sphaerochaeta pleomorpha str. Grapes]
MNTDSFVSICKALGDPHRVAIVKLLSAGEECACNLLEQFSITQPTLSHHMRILTACGLVSVRKAGKWSHYSLDHEMFHTFVQFVGSIANVEDKGEGICL